MKNNSSRIPAAVAAVVISFVWVLEAFAAGDPTSAINSAKQSLQNTFESVAALTLVVGAIVGLIGGITCYSKFSAGDPEGGKKIAKWFGGAMFLCLTPTIMKAFFL